MDGGSTSPAGSRRARVALVVAAVVVVLAAAFGLGVLLGTGKGGNRGRAGGNGGGAAAVAAAGTQASTGGGGQGAGGARAAGGGGAGGQAGSGGGTTKTTSSATTTATATSTTIGSTTTITTEGRLAFFSPPQQWNVTASCTPSKRGGYDFTVTFFVKIAFTTGSSGTFHYYWDNRRYPQYGAVVFTDNPEAVLGPDIVSGNRPSRTATVSGSLHILDPPSIATTVTMRSAICPS